MYERTPRLAQIILETNRPLVTFDVSFTDAEEARRVKSALEDLGCVVGLDDAGKRLTVTCPEQIRAVAGS